MEISSTADLTLLWLSLSPDIIGGCCRVGYDDIKKMRQEIDNYEK